MKEEKFPHTRKPPHWWGWGSFRALEERAATGVQRPKWRESSTEDWCQTELPSLRCLSARGRWWLGAEALVSEVRPQGEDWGWLRKTA